MTGEVRGPIYFFPTLRERNWWQRRFPAWECLSWYDMCFMRSARVVVVQPIDMHGVEINLKYQRVIAKARGAVTRDGRLLIVDWRGIPLDCERIF
jgi:hypothetical protein